jgi:predicted RNA-binding Zn ribbon-like protein
MATGRRETGAVTEAPAFDLSGGPVALDFANTISRRGQAHAHERLQSYGDLVAWARQARVVTDTDADAARLLHEAARRPLDAAASVERAIAVRELLYRLFSAVAAGGSPLATDLDTFNTVLADSLACARVLPSRDGFTWGWADAPQRLDRILWPVLRAAAELLTSEARRAVRECAADDCTWLFLDRSRNQSRRWCDMRVCGNRAKARRHYRPTTAPGSSP